MGDSTRQGGSEQLEVTLGLGLGVVILSLVQRKVLYGGKWWYLLFCYQWLMLYSFGVIDNVYVGGVYHMLSAISNYGS